MIVRAPVDGGEATVLLGRDFLLDLELVHRIEDLSGVREVAMRQSETRLALVS